MLINFAGSEDVNFGAIKPEINALLQQGVVAYRSDFVRAECLFRQALEAEPDELASYFCLYKIHAYHGDLDVALGMAREGLAKAADQAGWPENWRALDAANPLPGGPGPFRALHAKNPVLHPPAPQRGRLCPENTQCLAQARSHRRGRLAGDRGAS